jgi:hypothetical protein
MTTERRWLEEGASAEVTRLLESTVIDEPSAAQLQSLRARLDPLLFTPPGGGSGGGSAPAASRAGAAATATKVVVALALLALGGAVGSWLTSRGAEGSPAGGSAAPVSGGAAASGEGLPSAAPAAGSGEGLPGALPAAASGEGLPSAPPAVQATAPARPRPPEARATRPAPPPAAAPEAPASPASAGDEELELLQAAMSAPTSAQSLALVEQHVARFPASALAQEREVLAVQALSSLGRREEARTRAASFRERWPTSTHLLRLEALVSGP